MRRLKPRFKEGDLVEVVGRNQYGSWLKYKAKVVRVLKTPFINKEGKPIPQYRVKEITQKEEKKEYRYDIKKYVLPVEKETNLRVMNKRSQENLLLEMI